MSRTQKDKPIEFGGKYNNTHINKKVKTEMKRNRKKHKLLNCQDGGYINKILADRWNWD